MIVFGGLKLPSPKELALTIGQKLDIGVMDTAIKFAEARVQTSNSAKDLLHAIFRSRIVSEEEIGQALLNDTLKVLEQLIPHAGEMTLDLESSFDFCFDDPKKPGFDWNLVELELKQRQLIWASLAPGVPSMEAVPRLRVDSKDLSAEGLQKLRRLMNGDRSLVELGERLNRDPLDLARIFLPWMRRGFLTFEILPLRTAARAPGELPVVLSVDDSAIVRTKIARALKDNYRVLLASSAVEALNLMNDNNISLMLLDVNMPDVDNIFNLMKAGASDFFPKLTSGSPTDYERLREQLVTKIKVPSSKNVA